MNEKDKTKLIINAFGNDSWESYEKLKERIYLLLDPNYDTIKFKPVINVEKTPITEGYINVTKDDCFFFRILTCKKKKKLKVCTFFNSSYRFVMQYYIENYWENSGIVEKNEVKYCLYLSKKNLFQTVKILQEKFNLIKTPPKSRKIIIIIFGYVKEIEKIHSEIKKKFKSFNLSLDEHNQLLIRLKVMDLLGLKNNFFKQDEFVYFLNKNSLNDIISLKIIGEPIFHIYKKKIVRLMFDLSDKNEVSVQDVRKFGDKFSLQMRRGPCSTEVLKIFFKERLPKTVA